MTFCSICGLLLFGGVFKSSVVDSEFELWCANILLLFFPLLFSFCSSFFLASYPGPSQKKGEGLVYTVCACTRNYPRFLWDSYNSVPYRRLYPWIVRKRLFYCLGVALLVRPPFVKVYSFPPPSSTLFLKLEKNVTLLCV